MRQIAATHHGDKSPPLHCCCDKSLRQNTCAVHASEFGRGEMWISFQILHGGPANTAKVKQKEAFSSVNDALNFWFAFWHVRSLKLRQDMVSTTFLFQFYNQFSSVIYILALCIMQMPINLTYMQVKVKTWIKIVEPTLISVL